jgi:predicted nucleic acid-binding Zn ribbon protein
MQTNDKNQRLDRRDEMIMIIVAAIVALMVVPALLGVL